MRGFAETFVIFVTILTLGTTHVQAESPLQEDHGKQANSYLEFLDQGKYQEAWQAMDPLFHAMNLQQQWQQKISAIRQAYGAMIDREYRRSSYRPTYKNAPDGEYVIIQYETLFESKQAGVETVVLSCNGKNTCTIIDFIIN